MVISKAKIIDLRQTPAWANYLESINWKVEEIGGTYYFLKKLPILGWFLKIQRPQNLDFGAIEKLTKKYKIRKIVIEPLTPIKGFKLSKTSYLPTKTLQIDLTKSEKQLLSEMHPKTRYNIGLVKRKKIEVRISDEIENFASLKGNFFSQKKNIIKLYKAFGKNAQLFVASKNNKLLAGLLLLTTKDVGYYMHAATTQEGKKLFAPTLLTWEAILFSKKLGLKIFDFDGIYDERFPIKSWLGFTKFKKGFGGKEVEYPGCYKNK